MFVNTEFGLPFKWLDQEVQISLSFFKRGKEYSLGLQTEAAAKNFHKHSDVLEKMTNDKQ